MKIKEYRNETNDGVFGCDYSLYKLVIDNHGTFSTLNGTLWNADDYYWYIRTGGNIIKESIVDLSNMIDNKNITSLTLHTFIYKDGTDETLCFVDSDYFEGVDTPEMEAWYQVYIKNQPYSDWYSD